MNSFRVRLNSIDDVRRFVDTAALHTCDIVVQAQQYVVDAKSFLDMFSLDLSRPVEVVFRGDRPCADRFFAQLGEFLEVVRLESEEDGE